MSGEGDGSDYTESSLIEINFSIDEGIKLVMLRKSNMNTVETNKFTITLESFKSDWKKSYPLKIHAKLIIIGTKLSKFRTKIDTSFSVDQETGFWGHDVSEALRSSIGKSLPGIPMFLSEKIIQKNLATYSDTQKNSVVRKHKKKVEHHKLNKIEEAYVECEQIEEAEEFKVMQTQEQVNSQANSYPVVTNIPTESVWQDIDIEEEVKDAEQPQSTTESDFDREKCCKDGVWLKWIVERLENQEQMDGYTDLKSRIHEKHEMPFVGVSLLLRYFHGMEYNVDEAEEKVVSHINFMKENDYWKIDDTKIPNLIDSHIFSVYKEDIYERPVVYLRVARFCPSDYEFEEVISYCFWNYMNIRKSFKPHVDSHLAIYDMKGIGRKNFNLAFFKRTLPILGDHMPEI